MVAITDAGVLVVVAAVLKDGLSRKSGMLVIHSRKPKRYYLVAFGVSYVGLVRDIRVNWWSDEV